jgi:hypothetical protein
MSMQWRGWLGLKPTEAEFVQSLLKGRPDAESWVYDAKARTLSQSGNVLSLVNIFGEFSSAPMAARLSLLAKYRALLSPEKVSSLWSYAQTRIYPLMRSKFDRSSLEIDQRRKGGKLPARAARPFLADLERVVGYDLGATVSQVPEEMVKEWGVSTQQVLERALGNLKALPTPSWKSLDQGVWKLQSPGSYNESFLQWPKAFENLPVTGEVLAAVPNRGVLLASGLKDFEALGDAVQKALQELPWPLCGAVFKIADEKIEVFADPQAESRLKSLATFGMRSVYHTQQAALRVHCEAIEEDVFIASFGLLSLKDQPKLCQSWCSWTEGVESLLPKTDLIAFVRKPSGPRKTLLVNWSDASKIVAQKMRETSEIPARIQVDEFPTDEEWARLEQRAIVRATD